MRKSWLKDEKGILATQIVVTYIVFSLTIMGMLFVFAIGLMKNARANYMWFSEAVEFATQAANETGDIDAKTLRVNQRKAEAYFEAVLEDFEMDYKLTSFRTVDVGDSLPNGMKASAPGYLVAIEVKVLDAYVPLVGNQEIWIPMRYFAVVQSLGV